MNARQADEPPERRIVVLRTPGQREWYLFVFVADRDKRDVRILNASPVVGDKADAKAQSYEIHDAFAVESLTPNMDWAAKITDPADDVIVNLRPRFASAHEKAGVRHIAPPQAPAICERTVCRYGEIDVLPNQHMTVSRFGRWFARGDHDIDSPMAEHCHQATSIGFLETQIDISVISNECFDH